MKLNQTFTNFVLKHQLINKRSLNFLILMESILSAARLIQFHYRTAALNGNLEGLGVENVQGESVMKLDHLANQIIQHFLIESEQVISVVSEEDSEVISMNSEGRYFVYYDPLDGSSNVKHALPVGLMFGVAKKNFDGIEDFHLRSGAELIAAGMFNIPSGIFTFALKDAGCWRFYLDESGVFVAPQRLIIPETRSSWELSYNPSYRSYFPADIREWIVENETKYAFRYSGALATELQRILDNGGAFFYPGIINHPVKNYPDGKLRLVYEANVAAFLMKEAGGSAFNQVGQDILSISPSDIHQRTSLLIGSTDLLMECLGKK